MLRALDDLMRPPPDMAFDFSRPSGEPALTPAGSVSWRVFANPVSLFIGGVAAVLLELANPSVRSGVWDHSSFRRDPNLRLRRTGMAAMMTVYGPRSEAEKMIARVVRMHDHVRGETPNGVAYHANDPRLLDWVQATATFGFVEAYHRFVKPLSDAEKDIAFAEAVPAARLYGATGAPRSWAEWKTMLASAAPELEDSEIIGEFLHIVSYAQILPMPLRPLQRLLVRAAVEIIPEPARSLPQLHSNGLRFGEAMLVRAVGRLVAMFPLVDTPTAQAARRVQVTG